MGVIMLGNGEQQELDFNEDSEELEPKLELEGQESEDKTEAEVLETEEPVETEEPTEAEAEEIEDEVIVTIGDEEPKVEEQKAPDWVRELRKSHREAQRENRELKQKLEAINSPPPAVKLGAKPKLEEFDYDAEVYEQKLSAWYDQKREVDEQEAQAKAQQEEAKKAWQSRLDAYGEKKLQLKVKDYDDAEELVMSKFDQTQQGIVVQGADDAAVTFYALGKSPDKLEELAKIKDPVKFAFAVAKLETQMKVKNRKAPPKPERVVNGTAPKSGAVDSNLERLRSDAERTGDYSKIHRYKKQLRQKAKN